MASLKRLKSMTALQKLKPRFPEKWKGGRLERIGNYFYNIYADYKAVAIDTLKDAQDKPIKSSIYISLLATAGVLMKTRPNKKNFKEKIRENANDLLLVGDLIRNRTSDSHVSHLLQLDNEERLSFYNLGILTIVYKSNYPRNTSIFVAQCKSVQPHFTEFYKNIVDIGIFNRWIYLNKAMTEYDVNQDEWLEDGSPREKITIGPII